MGAGRYYCKLYYCGRNMRIQQFDYTVDTLQTLLWKYSNTDNLLNIVQEFQSFMDIYHTQFWNNWYRNVFNLQTANIFGLSVWCIILNVPYYIDVNPELPNKPNFGFNAYDPSYPTLLNTYLNFENSNFSTFGTIFSLTIEEQRFLLRLKYFQISGKFSIIKTNNFLNYLLSTSDINYEGTIYVLDGLDMSITYVFTSQSFPSNLLQVMQALNVLPNLAGVETKYHIDSGTVFGFGIYNQNFENGNFIQGST